VRRHTRVLGVGPEAVSARFRALCRRRDSRSFDARTRVGLRDRACTWTATVYLTPAADASG